jgi:uncharacterized protein (DUF362 family)
MRVSVRQIPDSSAWKYPEAGRGAFSPDEKYPEYPFNDISDTPNHVYRAVRETLYDLGLDRGRFGTPGWNPLGEWIKPEEKVFCLVNFVTHRLPWETLFDLQSRTTHASVIRAVLDYLLIATKDPQKIAFGNAPIQSGDYEKTSVETGANRVQDYYMKQTGVDVGPYDLRLYVAKWTAYGAILSQELRNPDEGVELVIGGNSLLEGLPGGSEALFRVGDYDHRITSKYHSRRKHVYVIHRKVLEADHIVSIPVLKTHEKVGITCAIKGCVGAIARKECLAHHRKGGREEGGDEYDRTTFFRKKWSEWNDRICQRGTGVLDNIFRVPFKVMWKALRFGPRGIMGGAWAGNDTCWRMALDINRCLLYGRIDGSWSDFPIRTHSAIVDGIVGGEGEGPIYSKPRPAGLIIASRDARLADYACAAAMGYDPTVFPIIRESLKEEWFPRASLDIEEAGFYWNEKLLQLEDIARLTAPPFEPPKGWKQSIKFISKKK